MSLDLGESYRQARLRIMALVTSDLADVRVPATPEWTLHDLVAHLAGVTEDAASGNMAGATTDEWTAAQVVRGREKSIPKLIEMWETHAPLVEAFLSSPDGDKSRLAVIDICTHEADLRNALGLRAEVPVDVLGWAAELMRQGFAESVAAAALPPVEVDTGNFEWFRGRLGRRTADEVCAYKWSHDPLPYLDSWFIFGRAEISLDETSP